jgi:hypothetical protein
MGIDTEGQAGLNEENDTGGDSEQGGTSGAVLSRDVDGEGDEGLDVADDVFVTSSAKCFSSEKVLDGSWKDDGGYSITIGQKIVLALDGTDAVDQDVHELISDLVKRGIAPVPVTGGTSSNVINPDQDVSAFVNDLMGLHMPVIDSAEKLSSMVKMELIDGDPHSVTIPANACIDSINDYLSAEFGPQWQVKFGITTGDTSGVGANLVNHSMGDERFFLPVLGVWYTNGKSDKPIYTEDPLVIEALRTAKSTAGVVLRLKLRVSRVLPHQEMWMIPLLGESPEKFYGDGYGEVLRASLPWHVRHESGVEVNFAEVLHGSGLDNIREMNKKLDPEGWKKAQAVKDAEFVERNLGGAPGSIVLGVRHGFESPLGFTEHPFTERFFDMLDSTGAGLIGDPQVFTDFQNNSEMNTIMRARLAVPYYARKNGAEEGYYSRSMDYGSRTYVDKDSSYNESYIDGVVQVHRASMGPTYRLMKRVEEMSGTRVDNGHLFQHQMRSALRGFSVRGGRDLHPRFRVALDKKDQLDAAFTEFENEEMTRPERRHNTTTRAFLLGEKAYDKKKKRSAWDQFVEQSPRVSRKAAQLVQEAGPAFYCGVGAGRREAFRQAYGEELYRPTRRVVSGYTED